MNLTLSDLQEHIQALAQEWTSWGKWADPDQRDCLDFVVEEAVEAFTMRKRIAQTNFTRNNPRDHISMDMVDEEVADTIIMCLRWFNLREKSANDAILVKLEEMHEKRKTAYEDEKKAIKHLKNIPPGVR